MDKFIIEPKGTGFVVRAVGEDGRPGRVIGTFQTEANAKAFAETQREAATGASQKASVQ